MTVLERSTPVYIGMRNSCKKSRRTKLRGVLQASCCLKRSDCCLPPTPVYFLEDSRRFYELLSPVLLLLSLTVLQLIGTTLAAFRLIMKKEVKRKVISLETKIEILDSLRKGDRVVDVAKSYSMNEATIRTIRTNKNTIRKSVAAGNTTSMGTTSYTRNIAMEKMEQALMLWIEDQKQKRVLIDTGALTNKALRIYEKIVEQLPSSSSTEKKPIFWQVMADAAQEYPANFAEIINDNSYTPDQVFNANESGLFWKKCLKGLMSQNFIKRLVVIEQQKIA
ncbi:hypothetical protein LAZ67_9003643 [Cordylochernes scorpioides]|uniref:HTH psq-type domain-containing protein n=1 Tax=Cordylochernes scorpioides TaxID=51811 RepID=A0ABY6KW97_9ARAC|nr:hypothetical protein LAZ67_9003643 [Cordylochernes scorpioides]